MMIEVDHGAPILERLFGEIQIQKEKSQTVFFIIIVGIIFWF